LPSEQPAIGGEMLVNEYKYLARLPVHLPHDPSFGTDPHGGGQPLTSSARYRVFSMGGAFSATPEFRPNCNRGKLVQSGTRPETDAPQEHP
jgi:hypothetical protein